MHYKHTAFTLTLSLLLLLTINNQVSAEQLQQHEETTAFCTVALSQREFVSSYAHAPILMSPYEHMIRKKGEIIFKLDPQFLQLEMSVSKAKESAYKAELSVQQTKLQRYVGATSPLISDQEITEIQSQINLLKERIKEEKLQQEALSTYITNSTIRASSNGTIVNVKKHKGTWAKRGELLAEFINDKYKELKCRLPAQFTQNKQISLFAYTHPSIKQLEYHRTSIDVDNGQAITVYLSIDAPSASILKLGQLLTINISTLQP